MFRYSGYRTLSLIFLTFLVSGLIALAIPTLALAAGPVLQTESPITITPELFSSVLAFAFSLAFAYLPGLKTWYGDLSSEWKASVMGLVLIGIAAATMGLGCYQLIAISITCDKDGLVTLVTVLLAALAINQTTYKLLVEPFKSKAKAAAQ